jgi:dTDP-4-dehydrorhamnose 3,5-epimerase
MNVVETTLAGVVILEPEVFEDDRGFFFECYNKLEFARAGIPADFVQDNHSRSIRNVLRGLHYQIGKPQGKLVRVLNGEIFDVAVDIRKSSPNFGKWVGLQLSAEKKRMVWIPPGFAHGFCVISGEAEMHYKITDYWAPEIEQCIIWNDPQLAIKWPISGIPILSPKDKLGRMLNEVPLPV